MLVSNWINLLNAATAANGVPSGATAGVAVPNNRRGKFSVLRLRHSTTAGNDARAAIFKLWGYCAGEVDSDGAAVSSSAGWDDTGFSYVLNSSNDARITLPTISGIVAYSRLYMELINPSGTGATFSVAIAFTDEE